MTRTEAARAITALSNVAADTAMGRGFGSLGPGERIACIMRSVGNGFGHVKRAGHLHETRIDSKGRRYGFGVDMARAIVGIMDLCSSKGVDIGTEIVAEIERNEARAKRMKANQR